MEQQPRKRGRPRLLVTSDVVERRKNSKRLQNAKRGYKRGEELSEGGCSAHSPNIGGSRTGDQSSSAACPALDDARLAGHANVGGTSLGCSSSIMPYQYVLYRLIIRKTRTVLHTNITLIDEKGDHILAVIRNNQKNNYLPQLKEQSVYTITNFKVVPGPQSYRAVDRELSINFFYKTVIKEILDNKVIPRYRFELKPFENVSNLVGEVKSLIDVIGMMTTVGKLETRTNGAQKLDVALVNERNEKIIVTLWEDRAYQFQSTMAKDTSSAVFVVISGLLAKKFSDKASLSSTDATGTFVNIDYPPLNQLRDSMSMASEKRGAALKRPATMHFVAMDEQSVQQLGISAVLELQIPPGKTQVRCLCEAEVIEILNGDGWYYECCTTCARAVQKREGQVFCPGCQDTKEKTSHRYRVVARVKDDSGTTTFTLFNKEAEQLIGVPLEKMLTELDPEGNTEVIPTPIKNMVGKFCAFQIKVTQYNITTGCEEYTVTRVSECSKTPATTSIAEEETHNDKRNPFAEDPSGLPERTNEAAGAYAKACASVAEEYKIPVINLWNRMQKFPNWEKLMLRRAANSIAYHY